MWPFTRAWPLGLVNNQVPTHSDLNKLDEQIAQAADGSVYTDIAMLRNLLAAETFAGSGTDVIGQALLWDPSKGQWWTFGATTGNVSTGYRSSTGGDWIPSTLVTDAPATTWQASKAACADGIGIIVLAGQATDASKVRYSGNGGGIWTPANTVHAGAGETPLCAAWAPSAGRWVLGFNVNATDNIETADSSLTVWTKRTNALATACTGIAVSAARIVILGGATQCSTSEDGITWTARTLPSSSTWTSVAYNAVTGKFMALGTGNKIAVSVDGITWTDAGLVSPIATLTRGLVAVGRLWVTLGDASSPELYVSANDGVSWKKISNALFDLIAVGQSQILMATGNVTKRSLLGGL